MYVAADNTGMMPALGAVNLRSTENNAFSNAVEDTPLLAQQPGKQIILENHAMRTLRHSPLVRQSSAPPSINPPPSSSQFADLPDVQFRRKGRPSLASSGTSSGSSQTLDPEVTAQAFRKALRSSSISQYKRVSLLHHPLRIFSPFFFFFHFLFSPRCTVQNSLSTLRVQFENWITQFEGFGTRLELS